MCVSFLYKIRIPHSSLPGLLITHSTIGIRALVRESGSEVDLVDGFLVLVFGQQVWCSKFSNIQGSLVVR